jgi:NitT/TauT family transport system substrate-binding protein
LINSATTKATTTKTTAILLTIMVAIIALSTILALSACSPKPAAKGPLRLGIMPDADSLPFMVAREEGLFDKAGLAVELVTFTSAQERDAALQAGALDGTIADILAAAFAVAGGFDVRITSVSDGRYGIAAAPGSGAKEPADLAGKAIGLSTNTIIQYSVDMMMSHAGIAMDDYEASAVPRIPVRMELLLAGQLGGAGLPEPLLSVAAARGAAIVATTDDFDIDAGIIMFGKSFIDARLEDIQKLYQVYAEAGARINADPDSYRAFLVEKASFPEEVRFAFRFVEYRTPRLPEPAQVEAALDWLRAKDLLKAELSPADLLDGRAVASW